MTLPSCRGSGKSAKKLRKTKASLRAPRLEEGSCNVIATLRHDQSATDRITPNQATGRLEVRPESPCRIIPDRSITFLHANHYDDSELQPFVTNSFARLPWASSWPELSACPNWVQTKVRAGCTKPSSSRVRQSALMSPG